MTLDLIYLIILCLALYKGFKRGIIIALFSVVAVAVGIFGALKLSKTVIILLVDSYPQIARWAPLITYIAIFLLLVWLVRLGAGLLQKSVELVALGFINRMAGALLYGFIWSFVFSGFLWLATKADLLDISLIAKSRTFPVLAPLAPKILAVMGVWLPFFKSAFEDLNHVFDQLNQKLPGYVGAN